jgi:hypothetical protein
MAARRPYTASVKRPLDSHLSILSEPVCLSDSYQEDQASRRLPARDYRSRPIAAAWSIQCLPATNKRHPARLRSVSRPSSSGPGLDDLVSFGTKAGAPVAARHAAAPPARSARNPARPGRPKPSCGVQPRCSLSFPPRTDSRWLADRVRACPYGAFRRLAGDGRYSAYRPVVLAARCCRRSGATRGQCRPSRWLGAPLPEPGRRALFRRLLVRRLSASISGVSWSPTFRQFCKRPPRSRAPLLSRASTRAGPATTSERATSAFAIERPRRRPGPDGS